MKGHKLGGWHGSGWLPSLGVRLSRGVLGFGFFLKPLSVCCCFSGSAGGGTWGREHARQASTTELHPNPSCFPFTFIVVCVCEHVLIRTREQVGSRPSPCGDQEFNSGRQAWHQVPLPHDPSPSPVLDFSMTAFLPCPYMVISTCTPHVFLVSVSW